MTEGTRCTCGAGCPTFGACMRNKGIRIDTGLDGRKAWDAEITAYKDAYAQGVRPAGTKMHQIRAALDHSDATGVGFDAGAA